MSVADYVVIGIIVISALIGLKSGLLKMIYKIVSYIASFYLAFKLSRPVAGWFEDTGIHNGIKEAITNLVDKLGIDFLSITDPSNAEAIKEAIGATPFPDNIKENIAVSLAETVESSADLLQGFIDKIAFFALVVLCGVALFIILRILFWLAGYLVKGISELPIIKQVDRVTGFILGVGIGAAIVFVIGLLLTFTASYEGMGFIYENIDEGVIAPLFYHNNILVNFFNIWKEGLA